MSAPSQISEKSAFGDYYKHLLKEDASSENPLLRWQIQETFQGLAQLKREEKDKQIPFGSRKIYISELGERKLKFSHVL